MLPQRSSSRKYNGTTGTGTLGRPRAESVNERPFMSVKRAYEYRKYSDNQVNRGVLYTVGEQELVRDRKGGSRKKKKSSLPRQHTCVGRVGSIVFNERFVSRSIIKCLSSCAYTRYESTPLSITRNKYLLSRMRWEKEREKEKKKGEGSVIRPDDPFHPELLKIIIGNKDNKSETAARSILPLREWNGGSTNATI